MSDLETEAEQLSRTLSPSGLARLVEQARAGESLLLSTLTPRQREVLDRMQALMCIVEGYSNHVMKRVGRNILPSFEQIEERVAQRQAQRPPAERLFVRLTGLEMKMEQYRLGEQFAEAIVQQRGLPFLHQVWEKAANLPTLSEVGRPADWIARIEGQNA
jgi:putative hydrolase